MLLNAARHFSSPPKISFFIWLDLTPLGCPFLASFYPFLAKIIQFFPHIFFAQFYIKLNKILPFACCWYVLDASEFITMNRSSLINHHHNTCVQCFDQASAVLRISMLAAIAFSCVFPTDPNLIRCSARCW